MEIAPINKEKYVFAMPLIVDPSKDTSNGVGKIFRTINITLAIALPLSAILVTIFWGLKHGFSSFI